ncbi:MAG: hypothetical protein WCP03_01395 [Candidatus Saccharibacteria bacterium]
MQIIKSVTEKEVFEHWKKVEKMVSWPGKRTNIVSIFENYKDLIWYSGEIQIDDLDNMFIISSNDWKIDGLCVPDFKLATAINNFICLPNKTAKHKDIKLKQSIFKSNLNGLDKTLIMVGPSKLGPFTIIEGNKRSVALGSLQKLVGLNIYLGISSNFCDYIWSKYSK